MAAVDPFSLTGKVAVVTGGLGLLGHEFALALHAAGAAVVIADIDGFACQLQAESLSAEGGAKALGLPLDVTKPESVEALRAAVRERLGRLDVLVNSAAINDRFAESEGAQATRFERYPLRAWQRFLDVNLTGNLRMIQTLGDLFPLCPIGYSGHETGLSPTWAAVTLGAAFVERHVTLDRAMWGSDHAASVEIGGFIRLVSNIRDIERSLGDGVKRLYATEMAQRQKLRRAPCADATRSLA